MEQVSKYEENVEDVKTKGWVNWSNKIQQMFNQVHIQIKKCRGNGKEEGNKM